MRREKGKKEVGERDRPTDRPTDRQTDRDTETEARREDEKHVRRCPVNWDVLGCVEDSRHGPPFAPHCWRTADTILPSPHTFGGQQTRSALRPTLLEDSRHGPPFAPYLRRTADTLLPSPHTVGGQQTRSSLRPIPLEDSRHAPPFAPHFWMTRAPSGMMKLQYMAHTKFHTKQ